MTQPTQTPSARRPRGSHSLAPEHLDEAAAAATVAVIVGGIALAISGIGIVVMALTVGSRFASDPPPNASSLGILPGAIGVVAIALGVALAAGGVGVIGDAPRARRATGILAAFAALLSGAATVAVSATPPADTVLGIALTLVALVFGVSALLLLRHRG